jgi:hypothetical protein
MEFKGTKNKWLASNELVFSDDYFNTHIAVIPSSYNSEIRQANAELIVEAGNIRQQIPFSLTELKKQRDEMLEMLIKINGLSDGEISYYKSEIEQLINEATKID